MSILHFIILHCKYRANRKFYGVFWNVLFLECDQNAMCPFWNAIKMQCVFFGMCLFRMCTFWNVFFLECAFFGTFFWNVQKMEFENVLFLKCDQKGICPFWNVSFWMLIKIEYSTLPTAEILSGKNAQAWVSIVLCFKKWIKIKIFKQKRNPGSRLEVTC